MLDRTKYVKEKNIEAILYIWLGDIQKKTINIPSGHFFVLKTARMSIVYTKNPTRVSETWKYQQEPFERYYFYMHCSACISFPKISKSLTSNNKCSVLLYSGIC